MNKDEFLGTVTGAVNQFATNKENHEDLVSCLSLITAEAIRNTGLTHSIYLFNNLISNSAAMEGTYVLDHELNELLFCAFRYALGRKTYITSTVCELIIKYKFEISHNELKLMIREIEHALHSDNAGQQCDIDSWKKVSFELKNLIQ